MKWGWPPSPVFPPLPSPDALLSWCLWASFCWSWTSAWLQTRALISRRVQGSGMPDRSEKEWEGSSHVTKIVFVFKSELVFSSNLFLVAWTCFWLSPLTIRECRTCCQGWTEIYDVPISSTVSSETTKTIRLHSYCDMLWIDGPHPHCDILWARKRRLIAGKRLFFSFCTEFSHWSLGLVIFP